MATKTNRLGETRMMNCGMKATIIRYGKADDIDVRFEDGAVVEHKLYRKFKKRRNHSSVNQLNTRFQRLPRFYL